MRLRTPFLAFALCGAAVCQAGPTPSEMRALFAFRINLACAQQAPELRGSVFTRSWLESGPGFAGWSALMEQPFARCVSARKWIDPALCSDIAQAFEVAASTPDRSTGTGALNAALDRHLDALAMADDALYVEDDARQDPKTFACPATPLERSELRRGREASAPQR